MTERPLTLQRPLATPSWQRWLTVARGFWELTKPGIIGLLLVTTVPTMIVAADGWPRGDFLDGLGLILLTLLGGILTAGGANTFNQWFDRDIDAIMDRTAHRPLPAGIVRPWQALAWGVLLATLGGIQLALTVNLLAALLAEAAVLFYVFVYTIWLKRSSTQNIVIGGAAGSIPPLVGWAAVTGEVTWTPFILFLVIFMWTPPHFWALALKYRDDYAKANVPMLPVVSGESARAVGWPSELVLRDDVRDRGRRVHLGGLASVARAGSADATVLCLDRVSVCRVCGGRARHSSLSTD